MSRRKNKNYNNMIKRILFVLFVISIGLIANLSCAPGVSAADKIIYDRVGENEFRGTWIATVFNTNYPSKPGISAEQMKAEIDDIIKNCKEANLNAIIFQVRPTSDAFYNSSVFPTSKYLVGKQGNSLPKGFDPLEYIIQQAHLNNMELHAWINPYRITTGAEKNLDELAATNPARKNPSWVVKYADGRMYYNPGLPEVRDLITAGVMEIVNNYDVDGIHFDDYFYPSPVSGAKFDDDAAFSKYGEGYKNIGEFRYASVNKLVQQVYNEIKSANPNVRFGISPCGIWANKSERTPTGSATKGFESYYSIYSDAKAWIEGGYIDYICPQIYWAFDTSVARYDVLVRWWSAVVDGTGVDLYIGHGAYSGASAFKSELEIPRQIEYARAYMGVSGSALYGYQSIADNLYKLKDNVAKLFAQPLKIEKPADNGKGVTIGRPGTSGATVTLGSVNIMGGSNPLFPVYYKGEKVTRTKSGFFSVFIPALKDGRNEIVFTQNNTNKVYVLNKGKSGADPENIQMNFYRAEIVSCTINGTAHTRNIVTPPGSKITFNILAPSKSAVTAKLGGASVTLTPLSNPPDEGTYMREYYRGTMTLPNTQPNGKMIDLGDLVFTATRGSETASVTGLNVKLINESVYNQKVPCEVINDYAHLKIAPNSSFYNDYLPASVGMRDNIVGYKDGCYLLGFGGYISADDVVLLPEKTLLTNRILSAAMQNTGEITEIRFGVTENVPINAYCKNGVFTVILYNTPDGGRSLDFDVNNPIFKNASYNQDKTKQTVTYTVNLKDADNFYGFEVVYEGGFIVLKVKNPMKKTEGDLPLKDMTIIVDAGHGGSDTGALGFLRMQGKNEKDLNLEIALAVRDKLTALGANIIMTRDKDVTVDIYSRMAMLNKINPDLVISVHHNSLGNETDNALTRGFIALYCNDSGRLLAKSVSKSTASELNRIEREARYQSLAMLRSHKFPAALFEMCFITNPDEYEYAVRPETVMRSADGIAKGVIAWIDNQQKWVK